MCRMRKNEGMCDLYILRISTAQSNVELKKSKNNSNSQLFGYVKNRRRRTKKGFSDSFKNEKEFNQFQCSSFCFCANKIPNVWSGDGECVGCRCFSSRIYSHKYHFFERQWICLRFSIQTMETFYNMEEN